MKKFLKKDQVSLINGGYLSATEGELPVTNEEFVSAQKRAEYVVTFARHAKNKDFEGKEADSLAEMIDAVNKELSEKDTQYVAMPEKVSKTMADKLKNEAKAFMEYEDKVAEVEKVNSFLQEFNVINDFEQHGLFFEDGIVKLNKIYTMDEIKQAVQETISIL